MHCPTQQLFNGKYPALPSFGAGYPKKSKEDIFTDDLSLFLRTFSQMIDKGEPLARYNGERPFLLWLHVFLLFLAESVWFLAV